MFLWCSFFVSCNTMKQSEVQKVSPDVNKDISTLVLKMEVDRLGNIYVVTPEQRINKYDRNGKLVGNYFNRRSGEVAVIDPSNPLQVLVYYSNNQKVVLLDNNLAFIKEIDLISSGSYNQISLVCKSNDDLLWIYDVENQRIVKVDDQLGSLAETNRLSNFSSHSIEPIKMVEAGNKLCLLTKRSGIFVFDNFGQLLHQYRVQDTKDFQFDGKGITYKTRTNFRYQSLNFPEFTFLSLPIEIDRSGIITARRFQGDWYVAYSDGIEIFEGTNKNKSIKTQTK